jgi:hypothetical protein
MAELTTRDDQRLLREFAEELEALADDLEEKGQ